MGKKGKQTFSLQSFLATDAEAAEGSWAEMEPESFPSTSAAAPAASQSQASYAPPASRAQPAPQVPVQTSAETTARLAAYQPRASGEAAGAGADSGDRWRSRRAPGASDAAPTSSYGSRPQGGSGYGSGYGRDRDRMGGDRMGGDRMGGDRERGERGERGDREGSGRPPAPEKPEPVLPENGPWLAKVTNIDDKANEDDLAFVFRGLQITNVQFVGRERRIGLVEFATRDDLYNAIKGCDGRPLLSRTVHVDVGEPTRAPKPRSAFGSRDREDSAQPAQRPRINLIIPPSAESSTTAAKPELADEYKSAKSNPFGDAKPRDAAAFERKREEERKRSEENAARWKRADDEEKAATQKEEAKERERDRREMGKRSRTENRGKARDNKQKDIIEGAGEVVAAESGASSAGWRRREEKPQPQPQPKPVEQKQEKKSVNAFALLASQDSDHE